MSINEPLVKAPMVARAWEPHLTNKSNPRESEETPTMSAKTKQYDMYELVMCRHNPCISKLNLRGKKTIFVR